MLGCRLNYQAAGSLHWMLGFCCCGNVLLLLLQVLVLPLLLFLVLPLLPLLTGNHLSAAGSLLEPFS